MLREHHCQKYQTAKPVRDIMTTSRTQKFDFNTRSTHVRTTTVSAINAIQAIGDKGNESAPTPRVRSITQTHCQ